LQTLEADQKSLSQDADSETIDKLKRQLATKAVRRDIVTSKLIKIKEAIRQMT
jgi:hypothetical protein